MEISDNWYLYQTKEKGGLESLPETGQWSSVDKTRIGREMDMNNQDPGVISDDEDDLVQQAKLQHFKY